ncbi:DEAD/DEAH box helicase domain-containing protein [Raineyella antarctica]|uniref:DEAD/DEAH box helicase domain-containing protein n=1 Tax=Raineyella antarctica TaxID=1577474 RepID=A0A1G6GDE3_9ACTN|nr:DEAD/DEAH box helicase [Raineyella antarctica]SDB79853.1 DEAD/DEAH box helicase domain-containing protein [Raineyella antarctica]
MFQSSDPRVSHVHHVAARSGRTAQWPDWAPLDVLDSLADLGITTPWEHQVRAMEAAHAGRHVLLSTGTASGKSLAYLLPVVAATRADCDAGARIGSTLGAATPMPGAAAAPGATAPTTTSAPTLTATRPRLTAARLRAELGAARREGTAIYLAPTKALAHDQLRACRDLQLEDWRVCTLDGDSDDAERRWARDFGSYVLTNPDMLHYSVLPNHTRWARLLGSLRYIVVDECHRYRGVFGSHVSAIIRRLRRLAAMYGAEPVVIATSATIDGGAELLGQLAGVPGEDVLAVTEDTSPHGAVDLVMWRPEAHHDTEAAEILADCVTEGRQTVAFIASRAMAERVAVKAQELLGPAGRVDAYRAGYLPQDRRRLERDLQSGALHGVAATNALELGVDIAGLDAVIVSGYPGTRAALWQQAGRAGRRGSDALVFLVARENPLDAYFFAHPDELLDGSVERTVLDPANPYVLGPHLAAAAQEAPLTSADVRFFGPQLEAIADLLTAQGVLRKRREGWYWTHPERAAAMIDIRGSGAKAIDIVDRDTGRLVGVADVGSADRAVHPEAVYLHQGDSWMVDALDLDNFEAIVHRDRPGYTTQPVSTMDIEVLSTDEVRPFGAAEVCRGSVRLTSQVVGYLRRDELTGEVWDQSPMVMPEHALETRAMWIRIPAAVVAATGLTQTQLAGAVHGAEHTAIGLLPMFASCDRWDIGGVSTVFHPDTGMATIFVHDGQAGGSGYATQGYRVAEQWWGATYERLSTCRCSGGCPSCVQSPKCGNGNQTLDKDAARILLQHMLPAADRR